MNYGIAGLIGLVSGIASGMFGVGGGIVMVPAMLYFLAPPIRDIKQAIGTSLVVIIPTAMVGAFKHHHRDPLISNVHWQVVFALAPSAIIGGYLGSWITKQQLEPETVKRLFGGVVIMVGLKLLLGK